MCINLYPFNSFIQWNCRSLMQKSFDLKHIINIIKPIGVCLQETFYITNENLVQLKRDFKDFDIYLLNRNRIGPANPRGGVGIMVHKSVPHQTLQLDTQLEAIAINITFHGKLISICSLYLPNPQVFTANQLTHLSSQLNPNHLLLGDFNAHNTLWGSATTDYAGTKLSEFIATMDNVLLNTGEPTRICRATGNLSHIDVSLASPRLSLDITWRTYTDPLGSDHIPIILTLGEENICDNNFIPLCLYKCKDVEWSGYTSLATIDISGNNINEIYTNLRTSIINAAELSLPKISTNKNRILVPWWRPECRTAIKLRNKAYHKFNQSPTEENHIIYKKYRALARLVIRTAKKQSWRDFVSQINKDTPTKVIWNYIKRINGKNSSYPIFLIINGEAISDPKIVAEHIANQFQSVSDDSNYSNIYKAHKIQSETPLDFTSNGYKSYNENFSIGELLFVLGKVRGSSAGPDGIRYEMIQHLSPLNKVKLLEFFNEIWQSHQYPREWTTATTVPIPKPDKDLKDPSSYRPIALTNMLCKVMERLVNRRLNHFLEKNKLINPMQSGFRKGKNTHHNLLALEHDIKKSMTDNNFTVAVFLDIEKAFDMCPRWGILKRLHDMGLRGNLPIFIKNFLSLRLFRVKVGNKLSTIKCQVNGVPQGSVLSPTLFIIMINDLLTNPPPGIKISLFADDVLLWISSPYLETCFHNLQTTLNILEIWSNRWGLRFSPTKTKAVIFKRPQLSNSLRFRDHPKV